MEHEVNTIRFDTKTVATIGFTLLSLGSLYWVNRSAILQLENEVVKLEKQVERLEEIQQRVEVELAALTARHKQ
jgi:hypothetical protein